MGQITIRDVAKRAGVSIKTVSRVVNNHPHVSEETKKRIWKAIDELGYTPREEGRKLALLKKGKKGLTGNIGCVLFPSYNKYSEPFFAELLEEIDRVLIEFNMHCYFTYTLKELENPSLFLKMINPFSIDGCIFIGGEHYRDKVLEIKKRVKNVVILSDYIEDASISCVYPDGFKAGYLATKYLISLGHKRIACITGHFNWPGYSQLRYLGYKKALEEEGIEFDESIVKEGKYTIDDAIEATYSILNSAKLPTAIFVISDPMAVGVYKALQKEGLKIPEDISVISCDNIKLSQYLYPSLTTVGVNKYEMVKTAIQILLEEIREERQPGIRIVFPVELIERKSCKNIGKGEK